MKLGAVILAAGAGRRLGGQAKALLRTATGVTFLDQIVATARVAGLADGVVVVAAPFGVEVGAAARALGLRVVENPQPERGMASSIALGFAALSEMSYGVDAAWLWPVDHPGVTPATLDALVASLGTHDAARPCVNDRGGHPPLVARALWARLASCAELPRGAREIFDAADVVNVAVADAGCVRDVDTASDLHEARG